MKLYLIRHGETQGNKEHRYVGSTDESLLAKTKQTLSQRKMPFVDKLYVSPKKRCKETAAILYPEKEQKIVEDFRECEFGSFEYHNFEELKEYQEYQEFMESMGESGFPGGETKRNFQTRCVKAFEKIMVEEHGRETRIAIVAHGGTIMALLDYYSNPHRDYYEWQPENGGGYVANWRQESDGSSFLREIIKI